MMDTAELLVVMAQLLETCPVEKNIIGANNIFCLHRVKPSNLAELHPKPTP
jgi:hypothetical protein